MSEPFDPWSPVLPVIRVLEALDVPYYIGGSVASSFTGIARATQDADIVAQLRMANVYGLVHELEGEYYIDEERVKEAVRDHRSFNLVHNPSNFKIDIFVPPRNSFDHHAMNRRVRLFVEAAGAELEFCAPEDLVLAKLRWYVQGGRASQQQWNDVQGVLRVRGTQMDLPHLYAAAQGLSLRDLLVEALHEADFSNGGFPFLMAYLKESTVEESLLDELRELGYRVRPGVQLTAAPGEPASMRTPRAGYEEVLLLPQLAEALHRLNPDLPQEVLDEALRQVRHLEGGSLLERNRAFHRMLADGLEVEVRRADGQTGGERVRLLDFEQPANNEILAASQLVVKEGNASRRFDAVLYVNGLPLVLIELKTPTALEAAGSRAGDVEKPLRQAFHQLQTYKEELPELFGYNELLILSDGLHARVGSLSAGWEWFSPWRTIDGGEEANPWEHLEQTILVRGLLQRERLLTYLHHFVVFEQGPSGTKGRLAKKIARYHQFHAAQRAVRATVRAAGTGGDGRGGVIWHTQGSGKSLTMAFFARLLALAPELENPTLVVLTDRIDLDNQLFGTFSRLAHELRQTPEQAESREELRAKLARAAGGIVFTTLQKFAAEPGQRNEPVSERSNIVVIADEAHRSHYGFDARLDRATGEWRYGWAQHLQDALPNATHVGFTGTPLELGDRDTREVFGDYISIYDIRKAERDGATVPIFYEGRQAKLELPEELKPRLDEEFEEITEDQEVQERERQKSTWTTLEKVVGSAQRLRLIARDLVEHFEGRQEQIEGKAMVVCMSRRICVDLYAEIRRLRPHWHADDDAAGVMKVVMTGSASDPVDWQPHIRSKGKRERLADRFKQPADPFRLVLVRDMWLTGFDAPSLHTMYLDKPMHGHSLMQAIARVNRVFRDKPGGLVVDYLGLAQSLKQALATYSRSGGEGQAVRMETEAREVFDEKLGVVRDLFHGFSVEAMLTAAPAERLRRFPSALEHVLQQEDGQNRFLDAVRQLNRTVALITLSPDDGTLKEEIALYQAVGAGLRPQSDGWLGDRAEPRRGRDQVDGALRQLLSEALVGREIVSIFDAAGLERPDLSVLSEEFLEEVRGQEEKNLAVEMLRRLLEEKIRSRSTRRLVESETFSNRLAETLNRYRNRAVETAQVIEELIALARELRHAETRAEEMGLSEEEVAFYDALAANDSAVEVLGDDTLRTIAREVAEAVRRNATIDWTLRESVRARLRVAVKRLLRKYGYPPDRQESATDLVLEQAERLAELE